MDKYQTLREKDNPTNDVYPNIKTQNIPDSGVTTAKIANYAITADKIANANITTSKIQNGAVTLSKLGLEDDDLPSKKIKMSWLANSLNLWDLGTDDLQAVCEWFLDAIRDIRFVRFVLQLGPNEFHTFYLKEVSDNEFTFEDGEGGSEVVSSQADCTSFYNTYAQDLYAVLL